jgi:hypothetical protein
MVEPGGGVFTYTYDNADRLRTLESPPPSPRLRRSRSRGELIDADVPQLHVS